MKVPKPKKPTRKKLIKELDRVFSLWIRKRDAKCVICLKTTRLTNGHLFSRAAHATRWSEKNCHCQCWGCNFLHGFDPSIYTLWFIRKFGFMEYEYLAAQYHHPAKFHNFELVSMIEKYKKEL